VRAEPAVNDTRGPGGGSGPRVLTLSTIDEITRQIADTAGLDPRNPQLLKFTNNAVVRLPAARAVVRIAGSATARGRLPGVIAAAGWLAAREIPAVRLWPGLDQPVEAGGHQATVWIETPGTGPAATPADLAAILKAIHTADGPAAGIPAWAPTAGLRTRLAEATGVDEAIRDFLAAEIDAIETLLAGLSEIEPLIPPGVIHGDAHLGNLIPAPGGPVICDFDSARIGPREWDLTPAAVGALRFDYGGDLHHDLAAAYGADVTTWPGFPTLRRLRELQLVTSVLPTLDANPALGPQWRHRLDTYRAHDDQARWTPYART
jgi:Ser/Thr protein kinase RdoA (MazF antagonist)